MRRLDETIEACCLSEEPCERYKKNRQRQDRLYGHEGNTPARRCITICEGEERNQSIDDVADGFAEADVPC